MADRPQFAPGRNIAMKVPPHAYDATVAFYRDVLGLTPITAHAPAIGFVFGDKQLWIDRVPTLSQSEVWLEVTADDLDLARSHLAGAGVVRCDAIEPLPPDFQGFWIMNPASVVHMVAQAQQSW
jgi:catechol 2,3-dioxygenase-like lactoylglutathione lyase family enzyme